MTTIPPKGDNYYGWELLFKTVEKSIVKNSDILVALAHYILTKESNLRCVGLGDSKTLEDDDARSELLPDDWTVDENKYALRYAYGKDLYILLGHITEGALILNLLDVQKKSASNVCFEPDDVVKAKKGTLFQVVPNVEAIVERIRKELVEPAFPGIKSEVSTQTFPQEKSTGVTLGESRPTGQFMPRGYEPRPFGFPDIGRSDLGPIPGLGSGMLLDFRHGGPFPRYDPMGPVEPDFLRNPNPDHLQPPGCGPHFI